MWVWFVVCVSSAGRPQQHVVVVVVVLIQVEFQFDRNLNFNNEKIAHLEPNIRHIYEEILVSILRYVF